MPWPVALKSSAARTAESSGKVREISRKFRLVSGNAALPNGMALGDVAPVDASVAWVQGLKYGSQSNPVPWVLFRTTDAGRHWKPVPAPSLS